MKRSDCYHEAKSAMAYAVDTTTLHIRFKTVKNTAHHIHLIHGDPFMWDYDTDKETYVWQTSSQARSIMTLEGSTQDFDFWFVEINVPTKRLKYAFIVNDDYLVGSKHIYHLSKHPEERYNLFNYYNFPYLLESDIYNPPSWTKDTVWYSIFPDRFHRVENDYSGLTDWETTTHYRNDIFFGGNLKGITQKLDYIKALGATGLYLTPIFLSPSAHKYDTIDYYEIDPQFGTKNDLKTLVDTAHEKGIKVMLDAVFNHVSHQHPFFVDALNKGKESPYFDCFHFHTWPIDLSLHIDKMKTNQLSTPPYETFAFTYKMPKTNPDHPLMRDYFLDVATYWIKEFDIDGWRLDVSNEVSHDFWREFRKTVKQLKPETFILGENWDHSYAWLQGDQFDAVMNYEFLFPIWNFFGTHDIQTPFNTIALKDAIDTTRFSYPKPVLETMFNLVDSHDTRRISNVVGDDRALLKLVYLLHFTLPGAPSLFYGGEIGLTGAHDPDNRRCMIWDESRYDQDLLKFIKKLTTIYHQEPDFRTNELSWFIINDSSFCIEKNDLFICINKAETASSILLTTDSLNAFDLFNLELVSLKDPIVLDPKSFKILKKK